MSREKPNIFRFKQFKIIQEISAMKIGIDGVLLGAWTKPPTRGKILDIGCGTGLLSLMLAQKSNTKIVAIDKDRDACIEAAINVKASPWPEQVSILHSDLHHYIQSSTEKYELIISNPPFFRGGPDIEDKKRAAARDQKSLEPESLIDYSSQLLTDTGSLSFIYPFSMLSEIKSLCLSYDLFINRICRVRPGPEKDLHRILIEASKTEKIPEENEMTVEKDAHLDYSQEFRELTKDFYLNF